jgi:5-methyltetrahydrofolate corrinoid/iron sulfur protein methyltransferase
MLIVADNLRITRPVIRDAVNRRDPEPLQAVVRHCEQRGARAIDINGGPMKGRPDGMGFMVKAVQAVSDLPVLIDTANPEAVAAGLAANRKTAIVNGISLEKTKLDHILPLVLDSDAAVVGYLLDASSRVPFSVEERLATAMSLIEACSSHGLPPERLIIDPVVAPLSWPDGKAHNRAVLAFLQHLADLLDPPPRTIAGLSNLTSGQPDDNARSVVQSVFLSMLAAAGLDMLLMDISRRGVVRAAHCSRMLLRDSVFAWGEIEVREAEKAVYR